MQLWAAAEYATGSTKVWAWGLIGVAIVNTVGGGILLRDPRRAVHRDALMAFEVVCDVAFLILTLNASSVNASASMIMAYNRGAIGWISLLWPAVSLMIFLVDLTEEISYKVAAADTEELEQETTAATLAESESTGTRTGNGVKVSPLTCRHRRIMIAIIFAGYACVTVFGAVMIHRVHSVVTPAVWLPSNAELVGDLVKDIRDLQCSGATPIPCKKGHCCT